MRPRLGPGPVFTYEWLTTTRRWQLYASRAGFVGAILVGMMIVWQNVNREYSPGQTVSINTLASYGQSLFTTIVLIELTLVLLAAPGATAGAVCLDKARGTLDHMLATDLSNTEIVLGKLGARLVPVLGLIACILPLSALAGLLGGIDPIALFGSFLTAIACAILGCSLALTLSVWGRKTHEVLMLTYLILILWISSPLLMALVVSSLGGSTPWSLAPILWGWVTCANPYYLVYAPYLSPGKVDMTTYFGFLGVCVCVSAMFVAMATLRIRGVALKQAGKSAARSRHSWFAIHLIQPAWLPRLPAPLLDRNPVLWREWHRSRPSRFMGLVWFLYTAMGVLWIVVALQMMTTARREEEVIVIMTVVQVVVGLLLVSVSAATSLAEERVCGSLDVLLSTPLSTFSILIGKWWGAFRMVPHVLLWPALMTSFLVMVSGHWIQYLLLIGLILAYGAGIVSLGLALATWVSQLGRAIALCVSAYVGFSFGWVFLVVLVFRRDNMGLTLVMGSPLYGIPLATSALTAGLQHWNGRDPFVVEVGAVLWILIHTGAAATLFAATLATFDRSLGRVVETTGSSLYRPEKKDPRHSQLDLYERLADDAVT